MADVCGREREVAQMSILDRLNERGAGTLPGLIGIEIVDVEEGRLASRLELRGELMVSNGYLHAATVVALADTSCGYGSLGGPVGRWEGKECSSWWWRWL